MDQLYFKIRGALISVDIEGLIAQGVPEDEYDLETQQIFDRIVLLPGDDINEAIVEKIISQIWRENFGLSDHEMELRMPFIHKSVQKILEK